MLARDFSNYSFMWNSVYCSEPAGHSLTRMTDFGGVSELGAEFVEQKEGEEVQPTMGGGFLPPPHACSAPVVLGAAGVSFPLEQRVEFPTLVLQEIVWRLRALHPRLSKLADVITRHDSNFIPKNRRWWRNEPFKGKCPACNCLSKMLQIKQSCNWNVHFVSEAIQQM